MNLPPREYRRIRIYIGETDSYIRFSMTKAGEAVLIALRVLSAVNEERIPSDADIDTLITLVPSAR
jgi:hypothetical protein